jgi:SAM-dependent methyltransferase
VTAFGSYSRYYDLLYGEKDYGAESRYVAALIKRYAPETRTILELGCGTGGHAAEFALAGYNVRGVDLSPGMLERANAKREATPGAAAARLSFSQGDLRELRLGDRFDAVVSLFHVMSYQTTNKDLLASFATAREHLKSGGVFLFDCWYGPGVLSDPPQRRDKCVEGSTLSLRRVAEPVMHPEENIVEVNYTLHVREGKSSSEETIRETHRMRYLFTPEIQLMLELNQMEFVASREWMSETEPTLCSWNACFIARG